MSDHTEPYDVIGGPLDGVRALVTTRHCACCDREFLTVGLPLECSDALRVTEALHRYLYDDVLKRMTWRPL